MKTKEQALALAKAIKRGRPLPGDGELPIPFSYVQAGIWFAEFILESTSHKASAP